MSGKTLISASGKTIMHASGRTIIFDESGLADCCCEPVCECVYGNTFPGTHPSSFLVTLSGTYSYDVTHPSANIIAPNGLDEDGTSFTSVSVPSANVCQYQLFTPRYPNAGGLQLYFNHYRLSRIEFTFVDETSPGAGDCYWSLALLFMYNHKPISDGTLVNNEEGSTAVNYRKDGAGSPVGTYTYVSSGGPVTAYPTVTVS